MKNLWKAFKDGFFGAFVLAASIVTAVVAVATSFVNGDMPPRNGHDKKESAHI